MGEEYVVTKPFTVMPGPVGAVTFRPHSSPEAGEVCHQLHVSDEDS